MTDVLVTIDNTKKMHRVFVTKIEHKFILGNNLMNNYGFYLDLRQRLMKMGSKELQHESMTVRAILSKHTEMDAVKLAEDLQQGRKRY